MKPPYNPETAPEIRPGIVPLTPAPSEATIRQIGGTAIRGTQK